MTDSPKILKKGKKWILFSNKNDQKVFLEDEEKIVEEKQNMYFKIDENLKQALLSENLIVLAGAGSSIGENGTEGKSMKKLWDIVSKTKKEDKENPFVFQNILDMVCSKPEDEDLEELLSRLQTKKQVKENEGVDISDIDNAIKSIEKIIATECTFDLPSKFPHKNFLRKLIQSRKKTSPRFKIFTLNYDECFEKAADSIDAVVIDGFSFSQKGEFRSNDFDLDIVQREQTRIHNEENFYKKVFHLYKLHGSVNWEKPKDPDGKICKKEKTEDPLLIYPNSSKYENSYQMPFFEMIARFQIALRTKNTSLFIIGYAFGDSHINRIIKEAVNTNDSLHIFIINPTIKESQETPQNFRGVLFRYVENGYSGITFIADNFSDFEKKLPEIKYPDSEEERQKQLSLKVEPLNKLNPVKDEN